MQAVYKNVEITKICALMYLSDERKQKINGILSYRENANVNIWSLWHPQK